MVNQMRTTKGKHRRRGPRMIRTTERRARGRATFTVMLVLLLGTLGAGTVRAEGRDARELQAKTACLGGHAEKGIELLAELYAETSDPTYIYNQGRCFEQNGKAPEAITRFKEYLRKAPSLGAEEKAQVQSHISDMEAQANQSPSRAPEAAAPSLLSPSASSPSPLGVPSFTSPAKPADVPPGPNAPGPGRYLRIAGIIAGGVGVLAFVGGIYMGLRATSLSDEVTAAAHATPATFDFSKDADGHRAETLQWVGYGVGAAALVGGGVMYFLGARRGGTETVAVIAAPDARGGGSAMVRIVF